MINVTSTFIVKYSKKLQLSLRIANCCLVICKPARDNTAGISRVPILVLAATLSARFQYFTINVCVLRHTFATQKQNEQELNLQFRDHNSENP